MAILRYATSEHDRYMKVTINSNYQNLPKTASVKTGAEGRIITDEGSYVLVLFEKESSRLVVSNYLNQCAVKVPREICNIHYSK